MFFPNANIHECRLTSVRVFFDCFRLFLLLNGLELHTHRRYTCLHVEIMRVFRDLFLILFLFSVIELYYQQSSIDIFSPMYVLSLSDILHWTDIQYNFFY